MPTTETAAIVQTQQTTDISALADIIGAAESDEVGGYNAANAGRAMDLGRDGLVTISGRPCDQITLGEIKSWQRRGLLFAVGRYQMIPKTLIEAAKHAGLNDSATFSPANQDRLLLAMLKYKRPAVWLHLQGKASRHAAVMALSREWAGLPMPCGRSYYAGINGNRAHVPVAAVHTALAKVNV